ncbi:hypothetical protein SRHO_G00118190 [Serrasalmus rhombeus]
MEHFQMEPIDESLPIDFCVLVHSLQSVRSLLDYNEIHHDIMIEDVRELLDIEQQEMMSSCALQPRSTDDFNYTSYHTLSEVRTTVFLCFELSFV